MPTRHEHVVERSWAFPASTSTVPRARRLVCAAVEERYGDAALADGVALVVGELAGNAVLHARTPWTVELRMDDDCVRVEVGDGSPDAVVPGVGGSAMTGRGIRLVEATTSAWGVRSRHGGKTVWATLDVGPDAVRSGARTPAHRVRLTGAPVRLWARSIAYHDDLLREAALMADGVEEGTGPGAALPADLVRLARELSTTYSAVRGQDEGRVAAALAAGRELVDVELSVPADVAPRLGRLQELFDEAARWAAATDHFLTPAPDPDVARFRRWYLDEITRQARGGPPRAYRPDDGTPDDRAPSDVGRTVAGTAGAPAAPPDALDAADAARSQRRLRLLAQVAGLVDAPLDLQVVLQQVADLAIEELADWCAVDLEQTGPDGTVPSGPTLVAVAHKDPDMVALALQLQERYPPAPHDPERERLLRDLTPTHLPVVTDDMLAAGAQDEQHLTILRSLGMSSAVAVPLQASGRAFGVMLLVATGGRRLDEDDVALAVELGRRAGTAVHKVRLAEHLHRTAEELALSEARYRTLVQAGSMAVWRAGPDGETLTDMPAWRAVTGGTGTQGWSWLDDVHPFDRDATRRAWLQCVADGTPYERTYRIRAAEGGWRWVSARAVPVHSPGDEAGPVLEWVGSVADVTDRVLALGRAEALLACARSLARALDVPAVLASLRDVAARSLGAHEVTVALLPSGSAPGGPATAGPSVADDAPSPPPASPSGLPDGPVLTVLRTGAELHAYPRLTEVAATGRPRLDAAPTGRATLPLLYDGRLVAVVELGWPDRQDVDEAQRRTLESLAAQYAAALVRARLYETERTTSLTLQAALAPHVPRTLGNVRVGFHYRPAGIDAQVGGDWADVIRLKDGRVLLALGDVMGSGIPAAATMGRLRTTLAALALHEDDPGRLLADLDRFLHTSDGEQLATLALAAVDRDGRGVTLWSAGHLPGLLLAPGARPRLLEPDRSPPLGVGWRSQVQPRGVGSVLSDGAVVALYSDGLLETRDTHIDDRLGLLRDVAERLPPGDDLDGAARALVDAIGPAADDDVTLLLARIVVPGAAARRPPRPA